MILSTGGKAHRCLSRLEQGSATMADLRDAAGVRGHQRRKLGFLVHMLTERGVVDHHPGFGFSLTADGAEALAVLRSGRDYEVQAGAPNARIFGRAA